MEDKREITYNIVATAGDHYWVFRSGYSTAAEAQEIIDKFNGCYVDQNFDVWDLNIIPVVN